MKKNRMLPTILLSSVLALLAVVLMTPVASAHTAAAIHRAVTATSQIPDIPNVNIITRHHRSVFSQDAVDCHIQGEQPCLTITNLTHKPQVLLNLGDTVVTLQPGQVTFIHAIAGPGTYPVSLKANPQAILNVLAS
jgi:hypothetical protein